MSKKYSLSALSRALGNKGAKTLLASALRRHLPITVNRRWYQWRYSDLGSDFMTEEWDNLIIIDAARPDILEELRLFETQDTETRYSTGSYSLGFMETQFSGRTLHDTVYVTANPHVADLPDGIFHKIIHLEDAFDSDLRTIPPEAVTDAAIEAAENHPDKRLIVHYMQPHYPFIGGQNSIDAGLPSSDGEDVGAHPWNDHMDGIGPSRDELLTAFRENHKVVVPHVEELVEELGNRTAVTADHTNLIGERGFPIPIRLYGHPRDFPHPDLLRVPWVEFDGEPRDVTTDPPVKQDRVADDVVEERLEAFGYL